MKARSALWPEDRHRDHLVAGRLGPLDRGGDLLGVGQRTRPCRTGAGHPNPPSATPVRSPGQSRSGPAGPDPGSVVSGSGRPGVDVHARCPARTRPAPGPARSAVDTASDVGALTATSAEKPAAHAFCTSSKEARPLTYSPSPAGGQPTVEQQPAHDLVDRVVAPDVLTHDADGGRGDRTSAAACTAPVISNSSWSRRMRSAMPASTSRGIASVGGSGLESVGQLVDGGGPAQPARRRGHTQPRRRDRGQPPGVDRYHVELAVDGRAGSAVATRAHRGAAQQAVGEAEAHGQLEVVPRRAHGGGHQVVVEPDGHGLLDGQLVGVAPGVAILDGGGEHRRGAAPGHPRRLPAYAPTPAPPDPGRARVIGPDATGAPHRALPSTKLGVKMCGIRPQRCPICCGGLSSRPCRRAWPRRPARACRR